MNLLHAGKKNAIANYVEYFLSSIVTIIVSPLLVNFLGTLDFGIWKTIQRAMNFGAVADGRATQALKWIIARGAGKASGHEQRQAVGSAMVFWIIFLPLSMAAGLFLIFGMPHLIANLPETSLGYVRVVGAILAINLLLIPLAGIPDSVLVGTNQGYASTLSRVTLYIVSNVIMIMAARAGHGLITIALIVLASTAVVGMINSWQAKRRVLWYGLEKPTKAQVRGFFRFSGWVLIWSLLAKLMVSLDLLLLSYLMGAEVVTDFVFTSYAAQFAVAVCFMTGSAFMPGMGELLTSGHTDKIESAISGVREAVSFLSVILCCGVLFFNATFVSLWAGPSRYMGALVNFLIVLESIQLIMIRNDGQIIDLGLRIGSKVVIGACSAVISIGLGIIFHQMVKEIWAIFVGIIAGRLLMEIAFPVLMRKLLKIEIHRLTRGVVNTYVLISMSAGVAYLLETLASSSIVLSLIIYLGLCVVAHEIFLTADSRNRLIRILPKRCVKMYQAYCGFVGKIRV